MSNIEQNIIYGWKGHSLKHDDIILTAIAELGGRIISLKFHGIELMFVQKDHTGETFDFSSNSAELREEKLRMGFRLWGGDKTWIAPQSEWLEGIPPIDLDAGKYSVKTSENSISMISPICRETGLRITRMVSAHKRNSIKISQIITNHGAGSVNKGIWNVTQFLRPVSVRLPAPYEKIIACENEGESSRIKNQIVQTVNNESEIICNHYLHYKYGVLLQNPGMVTSLIHAEGKKIIHKRFFFSDPHLQYAHKASVEVYNSPDSNYMELEIHSPVKILSPGESLHHDQVWEFVCDG